jgi:large subunit ribosomal protein L29
LKAKDVRNLDNAQLVEKVREFRDEVFNLRVRNATGELENTARMSESKRSLARALTIAAEREIDVEAELRK